MDPFEDGMLTGDKARPQISTASYDMSLLGHEDHDDAISDTSSLLSDPPLEMNLDCDPEPSMDLDLARDFSRRMSSSPSPSEDRPVRSPHRVQDVGHAFISESESEDDESEDESVYDGVEDHENGNDPVSKPDDLMIKPPLKQFYRLKNESVVSRFEKIPYEVRWFLCYICMY